LAKVKVVKVEVRVVAKVMVKGAMAKVMSKPSL
jgi:hypothetical protein